MSTLKELLETIDSTTKLANTDPNDCDFRVRAGHAVAINQAKEALPGLRAEYKTNLLKNSKVYFVNGAEKQVVEFAKLADKLPTTLSIAAVALYRQLASVIEPQFGDSRQFLVDQYSRVMANLKEIADQLGVRAITSLDLRSFPVLANINQTAEFLRGLIRESNGDDLNQRFIEHEITKRAMEIGYKESEVHVIILNAEFEEARNLSRSFPKLGSIIEIDEDDEVTFDFVKDVFSSTKKKKGKSKPEQKPEEDETNQTS